MSGVFVVEVGLFTIVAGSGRLSGGANPGTNNYPRGGPLSDHPFSFHPPPPLAYSTQMSHYPLPILPFGRSMAALCH